MAEVHKCADCGKQLSSAGFLERHVRVKHAKTGGGVSDAEPAAKRAKKAAVEQCYGCAEPATMTVWPEIKVPTCADHLAWLIENVEAIEA